MRLLSASSGFTSVANININMGAFIARQPNGLLCRFSTRVDTVTHYNMTEEEYITEVQMKEYGRSREAAEREAKDTIENYIQPFSEVIRRFIPFNNTREKFLTILRRMGDNEKKLEDLNTITE